ncbi:MAG TPA: tetratricopeptide repeat protein [Cytophagaceae bacterium]
MKYNSKLLLTYLNERNTSLHVLLIFIFITCFIPSVLNAQKAGSSPEIDSLLALASNAVRNKNPDHAIQYANEALALCEKLNNKKESVNALLLIGKGYKMKTQFAIALDYYLQAASKAENSKEEILGVVYSDIGLLYLDWEIQEKALEYFLKAYEANDKQSDNEKIETLQYIALCYERLGEYDKALNYYFKILNYYDSTQNKKAKINTLISVSDIYKRTNNHREALKYEIENLEIKRELKDSVGVSVSLNNIGFLYKYLNEYESSLRYLLESLEYNGGNKENKLSAVTMINIGVIYEYLKQYDNSLKYLFQALKVNLKYGDAADVAQNYNFIAAIYFLQKDYLKSQDYAHKAIDIAKTINEKEILSISYRLLSQVYQKLEKDKKALYYFQLYSSIKDSIYLKQSMKQQQLFQKFLSIETKEEQIKELLVEKERKELEFKKLQLEAEKKEKDLELLRRDKEIQDFTFQQQKLQQQNKIQMLLLSQRKYEVESKKKELELLHQKKELEDIEKQNKIQLLHNQAKINELNLSKREAELARQKLLRNSLIFFIVIALLVAFLVFNRYKLKQRTYQTELSKRNLEIEQKFLRAQMNPHFIFNAMNSIQSFISSNNSYSAERYLAKFARLMRYILENTSRPYITIENEIKTLQLYLELEQLRFDNKFDFFIEVSDEIDPEFMAIPPMLTQPYVENAIIHGVMNKPTKGTIKIEFDYDDEDFIVCRITDDGIGREEAAKIKNKIKPNHQSMGMQVTQDRLNLLNKDRKANVAFRIIDLKDEEGKACGTQIEIRIHYKEIHPEKEEVLNEL